MIVLPRLKKPVCPFIIGYLRVEKKWIRAFHKVIKAAIRIWEAQSAGAIEYSDCIHAEE